MYLISYAAYVFNIYDNTCACIIFYVTVKFIQIPLLQKLPKRCYIYHSLLHHILVTNNYIYTEIVFIESTVLIVLLYIVLLLIIIVLYNYIVHLLFLNSKDLNSYLQDVNAES